MYEIGELAVYGDSSLLLTYKNSDGSMYVYDYTNPSVLLLPPDETQLFYIITSPSMNTEVQPVYWSAAE